MKKHIIAAVMIGAFAAPALADTGFYIVFDSMTKKCTTNAIDKDKCAGWVAPQQILG